VATFRDVEWDDEVTWLDGGNAFTYAFYDTATFVSQNDGENTFRILTG
jgi:hypothetical protein